MPAAATDTDVRAATRATYAAFIGAGFAFASWAARIPQVRDRLDLSPSALGLVLFAIAAGSIIALPLSGMIITSFGARRTVAGMAGLLGAGLLVVAFGFPAGVVPLAGGLFVVGFASGAWDVAMNVHGAAVEQHLKRSIMSRFHAGFSLGTVGGALVGAGMVALGVSVTAHLAAVAVAVAAVVIVEAQRFLDESPTAEDAAPAARSFAAWREPRTLLIGVFVLAFAFAEGTANDWISVAVIDGYGAPAAVGGVILAAFLTAMTVGRWFGPGILDRHGRVAVVRTLALVATAGVLLFVFGPSLGVAVAGALLWGLGVSLGFPVGMSAGADEPQHAAARVSVIASIGYCAFLAGPPLVGFLGEHSSVLRALTAVAVLLGVSAMVAGATAPPEPEPESARRRDGSRRTAPAPAR